MDSFDIAIIGGGPAGMMAAISSSRSKKKICLLEKNQSLGKKLLLTGKSRCNFTNIMETSEMVKEFGKKGKFLYGALSRFSNHDLIDFFEKKGIDCKTERGGRVFPKSDKALDILDCLKKELKQKRVKIFYNFSASRVSRQKNHFKISSRNKTTVLAQYLLLATGGKSYPKTGSTGDGYKIAANFGHKIIPLHPALVPLIVKDKDIYPLAGLSLKNVSLSFFVKNKKVINIFGEMLFTHQGISGPIVLKVSKEIGKFLKKGQKVKASLDLKPALSEKKLILRIYHDIHQSPQKEYQSLLKNLLPKLLIPVAIEKTNIDKHRRSSSLEKREVLELISFLKNFSFFIHKTAPIEEAIVTAGGIDVDEINPRTMESRIIPNLFFAGEIIALDGPTGGFNLQKAFSTGWLAGTAIGLRPVTSTPGVE